MSTLWNFGDFQEHGELGFSFPDDATAKDEDKFDYVVVGAGASGSVVAARLALAGENVLLVEAGGDPGLLSHIPALSMALLGSSLDWKYPTISNNVSCLSSIDKQCRFARGKCLGGSTTINHMMFSRGNPRDFDELNIPGWTWDDLKPYFLKYEGFQSIDRLPESSRLFHNDSGIMKMNFFTSPENPWQSKILKGFEQLNVPFNGDSNGVSQIGVTQVGGYVYEGLRMSTARAYLANSQVKKKLNVTKHTHCTGLIFDDDNRVVGITAVQGLFKMPKKIYVRKEVVLSAGTIATPQILMLSGIGHSEHLQKLNIPVRTDLPVGDNMSDHVLPVMFIAVDKEKGVKGVLKTLVKSLQAFIEFVTTRNGPIGSNGLMDISAFLNTRCFHRYNGLANSTDCKVPSLQVIHSYIRRALIKLAKPVVQSAINFEDEIIDQLAEKNTEYAFIVVNPVVLKPYSRGNVRLVSRDPLDPPAIFPNYLGDSRDVDEMMRSIAIIEDLVETPAFKEHNASIFHIKFRDCPSYETDRAGYWRCYCRHMTYAVYHAVGTASLGTVVDNRLAVLGISGVKVADLSILPEIPRGNTEAVALAIGERCADFLLDDQSKKLQLEVRDAHEPLPERNENIAQASYLTRAISKLGNK